MESRRQIPTATVDAVKIAQECTDHNKALFLQMFMIQDAKADAAKTAERFGRGDGKTLMVYRDDSDYSPLQRPPLPFYDLRPEDRVEISDLAASPNQVLWGKYFLCQTVTPAINATKRSGFSELIPGLVDMLCYVSLWGHMGSGMDLEVPVRDPNGTHTARLSLYNYYFVEKSLLEVDFHEILPFGSFVVVQNPWFKATEEGFVLYVENPAEVQLISKKRMESKFQGLEWKGRMTFSTCLFYNKQLFWKEFEGEQVALGKLKELGEKGFADRRFSDALRFYDMALDYCVENGEDEAMIQSQKSEALLALGCFAAGLKCAEATLEFDLGNEKGIYRNTKALIGLGKYEEGLSFLGEKFDQFSSLKESEDCKKLLEDVKILVERKNLGPTKPQLLSIRMGTLSKDDVIPEFRGPFAKSSKIKEGKGRGLVATEDIHPGQLIICTRAFAYQAMPPVSKRSATFTTINYVFENPTQERVVRQIANMLAFDPDLGPELYNLSAGIELGEPCDWKLRHVDMQRIMSIVKTNAFGSGKITLKNREQVELNGRIMNILKMKEVAEEQFCGLWLVPLFFNHSCSQNNCVWNICGEWMSVRAIAEIKKGEELTLSYISPIESYESRIKACNNLGFSCSCALCQLEASEPISVKNERQKIFNTLDQLSSDSRSNDIRKGVKLVAKLASLRNDNVALNFPLLSPQIFKLVDILAGKGRIGDALSVLNRMYEVASASVCWHQEGVDVAMSLLTRHAERGDKKMTKVWMERVKELMMKLDGNLEAMRIKGKDTVELLKGKFGIDFFAQD